MKKAIVTEKNLVKKAVKIQSMVDAWTAYTRVLANVETYSRLNMARSLEEAKAEADSLRPAAEEARAAINAVLDDFRPADMLRTVGARWILDVIIKFEAKIIYAPKKHREGLRIIILGGNKPPTAYKYPFMSDFVEVEYKGGGWRLIRYERADTRRYNRDQWAILPDALQDDILADFCKL